MSWTCQEQLQESTTQRVALVTLGEAKAPPHLSLSDQKALKGVADLLYWLKAA